MICTFHSTDHADFCLTGYTTRIQNHCKVSKVSPFFKCLIGKFICKKDSRSLGPYNTSCHFSLRSPYTPYQRKKMLENCCCCFFFNLRENFFQMSCIPAIFHEEQFTNDEWKKMARGKVPFFFRPFSLSLAPTICPWVSEDGEKVANEGDYTAPPYSDNTLSWLRTAIFYRTLYPPRGYKR